MAIQAQLADGRILEFPDGTDPNVIQSTVKRMVAEAGLPAPTSGAFVSGFKSYLPQLQETYGGIKTLLGVGAERALGRGAVSESLIRSGVESMAEAEKAQAPLLTPERSSFTSALDKGIGSVLTEWLPYQAGSGAANLLESLGLMVAGGVAGTAAAPGLGTAGGIASGLVAKEMAKRGIKEATEKVLKEAGEEAAKTYLEREAKKATLDVAKKVGGTAAIAGQAGFYGTGQVTSRAVEEAQRQGLTPSDIELARVLPAAAVSTAAEFISDKIGLGAFRGLDKAGQNYVANIAKNILVTGTKETPTELVQSMAERFGAKLSLTDAEALKEYIDATAASYGMSVVPGTAGGVRGTMAARAEAKAEAERRAREAEVAPPAEPPAAPPEVTPPVAETPPQVVTLPPQTEAQRLAKLQEMVDANAQAQAERAAREGIAPVVPPRAPTPERTVAPLAEREMPQATPIEDLRAKQAEVDRRRLEAGLPTGESSMFPGFQPRPPLEGEPPAPAQPKLVDERPMTERAAKNRLLVLKSLYRNAGQDPESIAIVPHPTVPERFAIQSLDKPVAYQPELQGKKQIGAPIREEEGKGQFVQKTVDGETVLEQLPPSEKAVEIDPVENYVKLQRQLGTEASRRFVQDWEAGRITRADVEQALEQEKKAGLPPALTYTATGEREIVPADQYKPRGERFVPPAPPPKPPVAEEPPPTEEPPGDEPPPPTIEPPKTLEEFKQRLPIAKDNAKLRAANNNASFEDLANTLSASPNVVTARVGELAKKISKEVRLLKPKRLGIYAGVYNRMSDTVQMDPRYAGDEWTNTHEVVHALVARSQVNPTPRQRPIVRQLEDLYAFVYKETKRRGLNPDKIYGLKNAREFASEAMSSQEFQFYLMSIPYKGKRSAWTEFTRLVANLLGIKDTNALSEAINLVDRLAQTKRAPYSPTMFGAVEFAVEPGQPPVLDTSDIKDMKGRHKQMTAAARLLRDGKISRAEYDQYVNFYKPIAEIDMGKLDAPATTDNMFQTVDSNKQDKINAPIADGERVGLRMDLPARERGIAKGINGAVVSIHEGNSGKATQGKVKSFQSAAYIKDVTFEPRSQKKGLGIAAGEAKQPLQTVEGAFFNVAPDEIFKRIKSLNGTDGWVQVGFDPTRHGYFYDRKTKQPVVSASEMYQVGNFLLAKDVKYAPTTEFEYMSVPEQVEEGQPPVLDTTDIKPMKGRHPQMTAAAQALRDGKISRAEYDRYVNFYKPIATIEAGKLEAPAPIDTIKTKIDSNLQKFVGAPVADGTKVGLRLDIKARDRGASVVTVHEGMAGKSNRGSLLSYLGTGYIKDVTFEPRSQARGLSVAAGGEKFPLQTSEGTWFNVPPDEVFKRVKQLMNDPNWVQVGFDPTRHGYFYDRNTKQPVKSASEMYQVGNFLLAKDVTYAPIEEFDYSVIPPKNVYKTLEGYTFYELADGSVADSVDPDEVDRSWPNVKEFKESMPFAFIEGDKVGFARAMKDEYGTTNREEFIRGWLEFNSETSPDQIYQQQLNIQRARQEGKVIRYTKGPQTAVLKSVGKEKPSDVDMMVMPEERPTLPAGAKPMDIVGFMGIKPQKQEEGIVERTKRLRQEFKEDPELTKSSIAKALVQFKDKMENNVFSADAAFNNKVRSELIKDIDQNKEVIGTLIEMSQSQTVHSDAVAGVFLQMGGLRYDNEAKKWVGFQEENNFINLSRKIDEIAKKHNMPKDEAMLTAHAYFVAKRLRSLQDRNAEIETKIANLPKGDPEIKKLRESIVEIHLDDDQIQAGLDLEKQLPELREVVDIWNGIRSNTVKLLVQSGMWTEQFANDMLDNIDYVPFYRESQLEEGEGPQEFVRGLQVKAKEYRIKGSENPVNDVFDNMVRWTQYAVNRAIRNHKSLQLIDTALEIDVDDGKMAEKVKEPKKGESIVRVFRDGKQEYYRMADPLFMDAFLPVQNVTMPILKPFAWAANLLRQSVVLFPLFSLAQVPQDAFAAMFTSGLQPKFALRIPFLAAREYVQTLTKTSALHNQLKRYGAVGVRDFSSSVIRDDAEIAAGLKPQQTWWGKSVSFLQHVSMSADNAVRQAVYDAAMQQGLSKAEALEKAFDIINFRRKPKSLLLNIAGQTIPFFYAYLSAQRVAYNTVTGVGISPQERSAGLKTLMYTSAAVMALSILYAMMNEDDEEYRDTPTALRDRTITIPGTGGVRIPLRVDFFLLPKIIAEHTYHAMVENGLTDKTKFRTSMKDAVLSAVLAPGPFPQAVKAPIEVGINYDFFQGRPLIGYFDQKKDAERQFNLNSSEFAKAVGSTGLISPIAVDHLMRGMFGSVGGLFLYGTNKMINTFGPDIERPTEEWQDALSAIPSAGAFLKKSTQSALKNDFYQLRDEVEKAKNTFNDYKNYSPEGIEDFIANEDKMAKLALSKQVEKISDQLSKVRKAIKQVTVSPMMTGEEKQKAIRELRDIEEDMLKAVDVAGLRKAAKL